MQGKAPDRRTVLKGFGGAVVGGALAGCISRGGGEEGEYEMILGHATREDAQDELAQMFVDEVTSLSDGRIEGENFNASQLGNNEQMNQDVRSGAQHAIVQPAGFAAPYAPTVGVLDLPYLFPPGDTALQTEVINSEAMATLEEPLLESGVVPVTWYTGGFKHLVTKFPIETVDDLEDRQFRVIQSPELISQFEAWGAVAVGMALSEVYSALEQGVVEGIEMPPDVTNRFAFQEVTEQFTLTDHGALSSHIMVNQEWLESLPDDLQDVVREAGSITAEESTEIVDRDQAAAVEDLRNTEGYDVYELPQSERDRLDELGQAAWDVSRENDLKAAAIDELVAEIEQLQ